MWLVGVFRRIAKLFAVIALVASIALNVSMLMVSGVYATASAVLSGVGVTTVAAREAGARLTAHNATRKIGRETASGVTRRMQRGAVRSISSVGGEAIPVIGVAVLAGALALEVKDACDTAADMAGLEAALAAEGDAEGARQEAIAGFDCKAMIRDSLPEFEAVPSGADIWASVLHAPGQVHDRARDAGIAVGEVDWSGKAGAAVDWAVSYLGDWFLIETEDSAQ